jgi:hypothetical protein
LTLLLVVLGRHVKQLEFFDVLLGDRPALTPVESFYHRLLADSPDEAEAQAELLLKERSLSSYYDEVVLKALQLAAGDAERGRLGSERLDRMKATIKRLVEKLEEYPDADPEVKNGEKAEIAAVDLPSQAEQELPKASAPQGEKPDHADLPPAWQSSSAVLCVSGSGPLDDAASSILAQLVRKHGLGTKMISYDITQPERLPRVDLRGSAMICITYLQLSGTPAQLEYLVRRLRRRLPGAVFLIGLWPQEDVILADVRLRKALGADYYTSSMREAVEACLEAARIAAGEIAEPRALQAAG